MLNFPFILLFFVVAGIDILYAQQPLQTTSANLTEVVQYLTRGELTKALQRLAQSGIVPDTPTLLPRLFHLTNQEQRSIAEFTTTIEQRPTAELYSGRSLVHLDMERFTEALSDISAALELDPTSGMLWFNRGYALMKQKEYTNALHNFDRALQLLLPPQSASVHVYRGICRFALGAYPAAVQDFSASLDILPTAEGYFQRGCAEIYLKHHNAALKDFNAALVINPLDAASLCMRGSLAISMGYASNGCNDLIRSRDLGYAPANDLVQRFCGMYAPENNVYKLPELTVESGPSSFTRRIQNSTAITNVGQRIANNLPGTMQNSVKSLSFSTVTPQSATISGTSTRSTPSPFGTLPSNQGGMHNTDPAFQLPQSREPLGAVSRILSPSDLVDCRQITVQSRSVRSMMCVVYALSEEIKPLNDKTLNEYIKQLQMLAADYQILEAIPEVRSEVERAADDNQRSLLLNRFKQLLQKIEEYLRSLSQKKK